MKDKELQFLMKTAINASEMTYCKKLKVGAIAVKDRRIISVGYNGTISGDCNKCEDENGKTDHERVIHAEMNLIFKITRSTESSEGATVCVTHSPCERCATALTMTAFKEVFYLIDYKSTKGIEVLRRHGIPCTKVENFDWSQFGK